jgi:hypothetical protein
MCNFKTIKDAADVAIATMLSGIQVCFFPGVFFLYNDHDAPVCTVFLCFIQM